MPRPFLGANPGLCSKPKGMTISMASVGSASMGGGNPSSGFRRQQACDPESNPAAPVRQAHVEGVGKLS